ncbi:MAG TPA: serine/threonine-protein kinase [Gemmataceae bacterium]|nr:serine/threonine-protein kinase [Gemmataceae bacterium]
MSVSSYLRKLFNVKPKSNLPVIDVDKRFEIIGRTGQGSMSKVFRVRDKNLGRTVCLKILDKEKTAKFEARFPGLNRPMEGFINSALRHKNIVQTFEYGLTKKGEQYLVMELIEGMGLNFLIETKSKDLNRKRVDVLIQMADGLDYVHSQKYLHRDICPRNVMVTKEGQVKLIDFGLAVPYLPDFCKPGNRTGTPNYLAPELIKRIRTDHRVDLFALGVTAYELFTGEMPWEKTQSLATLQSHLNSPGKDPREFVPDLNPNLAEILIKAIERQPSRRFQTAVAFREALKSLPDLD